MIWLNKKDDRERDIITCNMIVFSDDKLDVIKELKKELMDSRNFILSNAELIYNFGQLVYEYNNGNMRVENQFVGCKNGDNVYVRRNYINPRKNCLKILDQLNLSKEEQLVTNINLLKMLNGELEQIDIMEKVCRLFYKKEELRFFMNSLWQDFYYFAKEVLDVIEFEEVSRYDILDLEDIQRLCKKSNLQDNCSEILVHTEDARVNERILKLAKKINDSEKCWENY